MHTIINFFFEHPGLGILAYYGSYVWPYPNCFWSY